MKRLLLILSIILLSVPLFAQVTISSSVPEEYRKVMETSLLENTKGRGLDAAVEDFSLRDDGKVATFTLRLGEKLFVSSVPPRNIGEEIKNILFYEESLFLEGETLDYIHSTTFSFLPDETYREGMALKLKDLDGVTRGVFLVDKVYEEGVLLRPLYLENPLPGLKLEKSLPVEISVLAGTSFDLSLMTVEAKASCSALVYPLVPTLSLVAEFGKETNVGLGLGLAMDFSFGSLWPDSTPILRNSSVVGSAEVVLGTKLLGRYTIGLENQLNEHLSFSASYAAFGVGKSGIVVGGGYLL